MTTQQQVGGYRARLDDLLVLLAAGLLRQWKAAGLPVLLPGSKAAAQSGQPISPARVIAAGSGRAVAGPAGRGRLFTGQTITAAEAVAGTDALLAAVPALIGSVQSSAASLAADFYDEVRSSATIAGRFTADPSIDLNVERQEALVRWATQPLRPERMPAGAELLLDPDTQTAVPDLEGALQRMVAGAYRQALLPARATIADNADRDPARARWAREAKPGSCAFCVLLATRSVTEGAVYRSLALAGGRTAEDAEPVAGSSHYHDGCRCIAVPSWEEAPYEPPDYVQGWTDVYFAARQSTGDTTQILANMREALGSH